MPPVGVEKCEWCDGVSVLFSMQSTGQTLQQIQICLDKNYKAMTCPSSKIEDACWTTEPIHYIPSKYSTLS